VIQKKVLTDISRMASNVSVELFQEVATIIRDPNVKEEKKSTFNDKVRLYGLYKRGSIGRLKPPFNDEDIDTDNRPARPSVLSVTERAKYGGWEKADSLTKQEAMNEYVKLAETLVGQPVKDAITKYTH